MRNDPKSFAIKFPSEKPLSADQIKHPTLTTPSALPVPGTFEPKQYVLCYRDGDRFFDTATAEMLFFGLAGW